MSRILCVFALLVFAACRNSAPVVPSPHASPAPDSLPSWDWEGSRVVLTNPDFFCGVVARVPGQLVESRLLAWRELRESRSDIPIYEVLWWGEFASADGKRRWVLTDGVRSRWTLTSSRLPWQQRNVCDSEAPRYLVFDRPPRGKDAEPFQLLKTKNQTSYEFAFVGGVVRRQTWIGTLTDPP